MLTELQILNLILSGHDISFIVDNNITRDYFKSLTKEFDFITDHYNKYNQTPDLATFLNTFPEFEVLNVSESKDYLINELYRQNSEAYIAQNFNKVRELLMAGKTDEAKNLYISSATQMSHQVKMEAVNILDDISRYDSYVDKCNDFHKYYVSTGFRELDQSLGGGIDRKNSYFVVSARAGIGKTLVLIKFAASAVEAGLRVGFYEGEMTVDKIAGRYDTIVSHISNSAITHGKSFVSNSYKIYLDNLKANSQNQFYILTRDMVPDNKMTVSVLRNFVDKYNLDILFIDQMSLLDSNSRSRQTFDQVADISKELKNLQVQKHIPIVVASQQNRSSLQDGALAGTQNLSLSDRIGQDATEVVFLSKEDNIMKMNIAKARDGYLKDVLTYEVDFDKGLFNYIPDEDEPEEDNNDTPISKPIYTDGVMAF